MLQLVIPVIIAKLESLSNMEILAHRISRIGEVYRGLKEGTSEHLTDIEAFNNALAAIDVETDDVPAELLLAMASVESHYTPTATSRLENGSRKTGVPKWKIPPAYVTGKYFCGVTQAEAQMSWEACRKLRDIKVSYAATVGELKKWLQSCRHDLHKSEPLRCALLGYGGGYPAAIAGTYPYAGRVLGIENRIIRSESIPEPI